RPGRGGKWTALDGRGAVLADAVQVTPRGTVAILSRSVIPGVRAHDDRRPIARVAVVVARRVVRAVPAAVATVGPVAIAAVVAEVAVVAIVGGRVAVVVVATRRITVAVAGADAPAEQQDRQRGKQEFADHGCLSPGGSMVRCTLCQRCGSLG